MDWSDVREYAAKRIGVPLDGTITVEAISGFSTPKKRADGLRATQEDLAALATRIGYDFAAFQRRLEERAKPDRSSDQILPWLVRYDAVRSPFEIHFFPLELTEHFNTQARLSGQRIKPRIMIAEFVLATYDGGGLLPIQLVLEEIELEDGSLGAKVKSALVTTNATLALIFALGSTPPVRDYWADYRLEQRVEIALKHQPMQTLSMWHINAHDVHNILSSQLNYDEPGLPAAERAIRVANVPILLILVQGSPSTIDRRAGTETSKALSHYAISRGLSPKTSITDPILRGHLITDAHNLR